MRASPWHLEGAAEGLAYAVLEGLAGVRLVVPLLHLLRRERADPADAFVRWERARYV
jgi:hypothetical protein